MALNLILNFAGHFVLMTSWFVDRRHSAGFSVLSYLGKSKWMKCLSLADKWHHIIKKLKQVKHFLCAKLPNYKLL